LELTNIVADVEIDVLISPGRFQKDVVVMMLVTPVVLFLENIAVWTWTPTRTAEAVDTTASILVKVKARIYIAVTGCALNGVLPMIIAVVRISIANNNSISDWVLTLITAVQILLEQPSLCVVLGILNNFAVLAIILVTVKLRIAVLKQEVVWTASP